MIQDRLVLYIHKTKAVFTLNVDYDQLKYNLGIILHSILFSYDYVHICENSNTRGRVTSQCETNGAVLRGCHDYHHHVWGEKRTKDSFRE